MNTKPTIVSIAVKIEPEPRKLVKFIQNKDLSIIIEDLCRNRGIADPYNYALKFEKPEIYVTEQNRTEIKDGSFLTLTFSPTKVARDIIQDLKSLSDGTMGRTKKKMLNLQNLSEISIDKTFSVEFIKEKGLVSLIDFIEKTQHHGQLIMLSDALDSIIKIMRHDIVPWDNLGISFIIVIANFVKSSKSQEIVQCSLSILESIVLNCNDKYGLIEKEVGFPKRLLQRLENENLKQNVLSLINALFLKADSNAQKNIANTLFSKDNLYIFQNIIELSEVKQEMAHQLYVTQTLYLNLLAERMSTPIDPEDQNVNDKFKELRKIEFELDTTGGKDPCGKHFGPFVIDNRLGFTDEENPALDFTSTPPGILAFDCISYFAENHKEDYAKVILENSCRTDKLECPVGRSSVEIVRILCKRFKIGVTPCEHKTKYFKLCFSHEYPFYELYRVCIIYMSTIWRKMRATVEDFDKVLNIAMTQVNCEMNSRPVPANFEILLQKLSNQTDLVLNNQRLLESIDKGKQDSRLYTEKKLVETVKPELVQLIKKQRLNYMIEGTRFKKIEQGGQEKYMFLKLSKNHKFVYYGDCDDTSIPVKEKLKDMLRVFEIKSLDTGKDHLQIIRGHKSQSLIFSLSMKSKDEPFFFIAPNEKSYDYWIDGINALLGNEMTSKEAESDLNKLLTMEIKLRTLEIE